MLIKGISEIAQDYDTFLVDLYGVMHNGVNHFEGAVEAVNYLKDQKKLVIFFSNIPRPKEVVRKKLLSMSKKFARFEVVTSGEFFNYVLQHPYKYGLDYLQGYGLALINEFTHPLLKLSKLNITDSVDKANYLLIMAYAKNQNELGKFDDIMKQAIAYNLPAVCPNPDLVANQGNSLVYTAGSFALKYKQLGGRVSYFGKPEKSFYKFALDNYSNSVQYILGVGDNIETDIKGAINFGIDSLLVRDGIHKTDNIDTLLNTVKLKPKYVIDSFIL